MTNEPPKGLKAGLLRTYLSDPFSSPSFSDGCLAKGNFHKLLFGLAVFHSIVQASASTDPHEQWYDQAASQRLSQASSKCSGLSFLALLLPVS